ncbi:MAG: slipin family protein [Candidatus Obscuribacterales bacterium]|nr:slipin family protein [Candidatus Obscuribacterales bacterium]
MELLLVFLFFLFGYTLSSIRVIKEYEKIVVFTLGRADGVRGPGLQLVFPLLQQSKKVDLRVLTMPIPMQEAITKDNVSVKTAAVCFFQVDDAFKAVTKIEDPLAATMQIAQTTLRSILGQHELDELLTERDAINAKLSAVIDRQTEGWGIKVMAVEVKDVEIPQSMQRAMAKQAEAERERRAKIVAAEGEMQAAEKLAQAAEVISATPGAMQLRQLQTMVEVSAEKNSTLIFPIPIEFMDMARGAAKLFQEDKGEKIKIKEKQKEETP